MTTLHFRPRRRTNSLHYIWALMAGLFPAAPSHADPATTDLAKEPVAPVYPNAAKFVFQIPVYPGTAPFESYAYGLSDVHSPFGAVLRIYKTQDGGPLDLEKVMAFYTNALGSKGWSDRGHERRNASLHLFLSTQVYEMRPGPPVAPDADGRVWGAPQAYNWIQASGDFHMWVAPKDGMLTISMRQLRNSRMRPATTDQVAKIVSSLLGGNAESEYRAGKWKDRQNSAWEEAYANEYLLERLSLSLHDPEVEKDMAARHERRIDIDPNGILSIGLLAFRDDVVAAAEAERQQRAMNRDETVLRIGDCVVTFSSRFCKRKEWVQSVVTKLQDAMK